MATEFRSFPTYRRVVERVPRSRAQGKPEGPCRTLIWGANGDESSSIPGYALDMVADDPLTRDALQAVAFGRAVTPEGQTAAAQALQALRELDELASAARTGAVAIPAVPVPGVGGARRAATGTGVASGSIMVEIVDDSQAFRDGAWRGGPNRVTESLRRFWVVPVVVASLAVGAVGGVVSTHAAEKPSTSLAPAGQATAPADNGEPSYSADQGDAAAAADSEVTALSTAAVLANVEAWLGPPRLPSDNFPDEATLTASGIDPSSTHFVMTGGTMRLWAARGFDGSLCLVMMATVDGGSQSGCVPENQFLIDGVSIAGDSASAHWRTDGTIESKG
jgi:hypothetical protein